MPAAMSISLLLHVKSGKRRPAPPIFKGEALELGVNAPAVEGKANLAVIEALSEWLGVPKSALTLTHGHQGRRKRVEVNADAPTLARINSFLAGVPHE